MTAPQRRAAALLVVATWLAIDLIRFSGPLLSWLFDEGLGAAVAAALATFAGAGLVVVAVTIVGRRSGLGSAVLGLAVPLVALRVLLPFLEGDVLVIYGLITTALALALMLLAARSAAAAGGGGAVAAAVATGALTALLEQGVLRTWDGLWRDDVRGWVLAAVLGVALLVAAFRARSAASERPVRGLWVVGIWLSLAVYAFANLAFLTSQTGYRLGVALILGALGLSAGAYVASRRTNMPAPLVGTLGAVALLGVWTLVTFTGPIQLLMAPLAAATTTYLAGRAVHSPSSGGASLRSFGGLIAAGLLTLLPFMLIQLDLDVPLGFPAGLIAVAAVLAVAVAGTVQAARHDAKRRIAPAIVGFRRRAGSALIAAALLGAVSLVTFADGGADSPEAPVAELRIVNWNLHYGVTPADGGGPDVDLAEIAAAIEDQDADVVLLQEVQRGWVLGGGSDMLLYLADALDMHYAFAPAHDRHFGNAVLSRYPIVDDRTVALPFGDGPQHRSALIATIDTGADAGVSVTSVHLQHRASNDATRLAQAEVLAEALPTEGVRVVGGDFNSGLDDAPLGLLLDAGYFPMTDAGEDAVAADVRIDAVVIAGTVFFDYVAIQPDESDHPLLAVTVVTATLDAQPLP